MYASYGNEAIDPGTINVTATYTHTTGTTKSDCTYDMTNDTDSKQTADLPWTIDELINCEFFLVSLESTPGNYIDLYIGGVDLQNIIVSKYSRRAGASRQIRDAIRSNMGGRNNRR